MQLGTRWSIGHEPPSRLPAVMVGAIAEVEHELEAVDGLQTDGWRWTLTWLEGRPIVELADGTVLSYHPTTESVVRSQLE